GRKSRGRRTTRRGRARKNFWASSPRWKARSCRHKPLAREIITLAVRQALWWCLPDLFLAPVFAKGVECEPRSSKRKQIASSRDRRIPVIRPEQWHIKLGLRPCSHECGNEPALIPFRTSFPEAKIHVTPRSIEANRLSWLRLASLAPVNAPPRS